MKHRPVWKVIVFGIITLGIYDIYWMYATRKELVAKGQKVPRVIVNFIPLFVIVGVLLIAFGLGALLRSSGQAEGAALGIVTATTTILVLLSLVALFPVSIWWAYMYSRAVGNVTKNEMSLGLSFGLWILLGFCGLFPIWPGIIQDSFNKLSH